MEGSDDVYVHKFSISMGGKTLFNDCKLSLAYGRRYGLIGALSAPRIPRAHFVLQCLAGTIKAVRLRTNALLQVGVARSGACAALTTCLRPAAGPNGCGKSTLMTALGTGTNEEIKAGTPPNMDILLVEQEVEASEEITALQMVLSADTKRTALLAEAEKLEKELEVGGVKYIKKVRRTRHARAGMGGCRRGREAPHAMVHAQ